MNEATMNYVRQHADDDVRQLALRGCKDDEVDLTLALQQIQGRQTAKHKVPSWAAADGVLYPPHLNMEQCSSEATARYKGELCRQLLDDDGKSLLVDLTGGWGVDFAFMSSAFTKAIYVERDAGLCSIVRHNFEVLLLDCSCVNTDGVDYLDSMDHATVIYMDPARRDAQGGRTYAIDQCTPNVLLLKEKLQQKADYVLLKLSPMVDWRQAVVELGTRLVRQVHIVAVGGECKELLVLLSRSGCGLSLVCSNDGDYFRAEEDELQDQPVVAYGDVAAGHYLYEPHAALMKAGCFHLLASRFGVKPLAPNSHLFVSTSPVTGFPGRCFRVSAVSSLNKRELRRSLGGLTHANISVRNFPVSVAGLRQRLKLQDGGQTYIFATTLANGTHVLLVCER